MTVPGALPDPEALVIGWLTGRLSAALVVADLPPDVEDHLPVVQVTGLPGSVSDRGWNGDRWITAHPRFDVDTYATTRAAASDLCRDVEALLAELPGAVTGGAVVADVVSELGPARRPDFNTRVTRYGSTYALVLRRA